MKAALPLALLLVLPDVSGATECAVTSGPQRAALVELYTSEGCNSCPPADRWFSRLPTGSGSPAIPLAFHVDYWDHIGWKDRFASPAWSARQREVARRGGARIVYTPQVLFDGRDLEWHSGAALGKALDRAAAKPPGATIRVQMARRGETLSIVSEAALAGGREAEADLYAAVTQSRLTTDVKAGENRGERLVHDHVVRSLGKVGAVGATRRSLSHSRPLGPDWKVDDLAVVVWAEDRGTGEVLQAVRLAACPGG
jgi:hypothetical protein